jgi:hypothetical protein
MPSSKRKGELEQKYFGYKLLFLTFAVPKNNAR